MAVTFRTARTSTARRLALGAVAGVVAVTSFAAGVSGATGEAADPGATVQYAVTKPVCNQASTPGVMRCFSYKRVPVKKGTKHAYRYRTDASRGPAGGYTPRALATAYNFNPRINRSNLTVAIVLWHDSPYALSDLNVFNAKYGLKRETTRSFRKVNQRGASAPLPVPNRGAAGEIALDTQAVRGACNTCRILLVEADGPYDTDLAKAVNTAVRLGADVISNSYGTVERRASATLIKAFNHPGVVLTVSTGDDGWFNWDYGNSPGDRGDGVPSFPGTSPYVVSVGGTTLKLDGANRRTSETVWNNNGPHDSVGAARRQPMGATGGGCSTLYTARPFQSHHYGYLGARCSGKRLAADMSVVGDPQTGFDVFDRYGSGGWVTIGGTSLSAPLAAGMFALAGGAQGARYPASAVYGNSRVHPGTRFDVTVGGNGFCNTDLPRKCSDAIYTTPGLLTPGTTRNPNKLNMGLADCSFPRNSSEYVPTSRSRECTAAYAFDGPSGVGTPRSLTLFKRTDPTVTFTRPASTPRGRSTSFVAHIHQRLPRTYLKKINWTWGDGKTSVTTGRAMTHTYYTRGTYTVTVTTLDSRYQSTVQKTKIVVR